MHCPSPPLPDVRRRRLVPDANAAVESHRTAGCRKMEKLTVCIKAGSQHMYDSALRRAHRERGELLRNLF